MPGTFTGLGGREHQYCTHLHNAAETNERSVEVPIFFDWITRHPGYGLEVGNVLGYYDPAAYWAVIDMYERWPKVLNTNIEDFKPTYCFDWIVTISTIEHIGWDYEPRDPDKALGIIDLLRSMLVPDTGRLLVSFPTGHHPALDTAAADGTLAPLDSVLMYRTDEPEERQPGTWVPGEFRSVPYLHHAWSAGATWIAEFGPLPTDG